MVNFLKRYWNCDAGFIVSAEMLFLYTITVLGIIVGMTNVQRAMITEFTDVANSLLAVDQTWSLRGFIGQDTGTGNTSTASMAFVDVTTVNATASDYVNFTVNAAATAVTPTILTVIPTP